MEHVIASKAPTTSRNYELLGQKHTPVIVTLNKVKLRHQLNSKISQPAAFRLGHGLNHVTRSD